MSLVNDSLQDLEARRDEEALSNYSAASVRLGYSDKNTGTRKALFAGVAMVAIAVAIFLIQSPPSEEIAPTGIVEQLPSQPTASLPATPGFPQTEPPLSEAVEKTITLLLQSASKALQQDRLTTPANTNARSYFEQVLQLQPDNPEAKAGLQAITNRYTVLAQAKWRQGYNENALTLVNAGLSVAPDNQRLLSLRTEIETNPQARLNPTLARQSSQLSTEATGGHVRVQRSSASTDNQQVQAAQNKADEGDIAEAIADLEQLYQSSQIGKKGLSLLADFYLQQHRPEDATEVAKQQSILSEARAAYIIARAQVQGNNLAGALATLESQSPDIRGFPDYYALLAGIHQQGGQYLQAAPIYNRLTQLQPESYTHWLGLAAALDNLRDDNALKVFRKVMPMIPKQQTELRQYVQQRMDRLSNS